MNPDRLAAIREDHTTLGRCERCRHPILGPCDAMVLLAEVDRLNALLENAHRDRDAAHERGLHEGSAGQPLEGWVEP